MKKSIDKQGLSAEESVKLSSAPSSLNKEYNGVAGAKLVEPIPSFIKAKSENVISGENNSWIVLGRDRPASRVSGYGGIGDTQCGSIDIVVGRMASKPKSGVWVDPNFFKDAARIYISQKTDIDENFGLAQGKVGNSIARSGIAIKADGIRVISREGIKLVTVTDAFNSMGGEANIKFGVDIIANNNDEDLQPMVKGKNLEEALEELTDKVEELSGIVSAFLSSQMDYNASLATHTHISPFFGIIGPPSTDAVSAGIKSALNKFTDCVSGLTKFVANLNFFKAKYIRPFGEKYINSEYNNVN